MKVQSTYEFDVSQAELWRLLNDPEVLASTIPGVKSFTPAGSGRYQATMNVGIGPVRGSYQGAVQVTDPDPPNAYTLKVEGKGPGAFIKGSGRITLSAETSDKTRVDVEGDAQVGGVLARVGQRMIGNASKTVIRQFFDNVKKRAKQGAV